MLFIWGKFKNLTTLITLVGCILCIGLIALGVNAIVVLVVLGILNLYVGTYTFIEKRTPFRTDYTKIKDQIIYCEKQGICLMGLGLYIILMSVLYFINLIPTHLYWDVFLIGLLFLVFVGFYFQRKSNK